MDEIFKSENILRFILIVELIIMWAVYLVLMFTTRKEKWYEYLCNGCGSITVTYGVFKFNSETELSIVFLALGLALLGRCLLTEK